MNNSSVNKLSLYIHIPFCLSKCAYCDFTSFENATNFHEKYIDSLLKEVSSFKETLLKKGIHTIFIGGGTPTSLNDYIFEKLLKNINEILNLKNNKQDIEYTIEANPKTISDYKANIMKFYGINRISLGLQSIHYDELKTLGRIHTFDDLKNSINILRNNKIYNINIDLMYAIPNQSYESFKESVENVLSLKIPHISCYSLILEEGTKLFKMFSDGNISLPSEDEDISMYELAVNMLTNNGYNHYEISNFAIPNYECKHNITYWKSKEYLGFGVSAHSYFNNNRYSNTENLDEYIELIDKNFNCIHQEEFISDSMAFEECIFLGLRLNEGISIDYINTKFKLNFISYYKIILDKLQNEGLLIYDDKNLKLTLKGFELSNYVFLKILSK